MSGAIRLGVAAALLAPLVCFIASYVLHGGAWSDLPPVLAASVLNSALTLIEYALTNPLKAAIFITISWVAGRLAFRR